MAEIGAERQPNMSKKHCRYPNLFVSISIEYVEGARYSIVVEGLCYKPEGRGFETR
jgi:hypothetical protein